MKGSTDKVVLGEIGWVVAPDPELVEGRLRSASGSFWRAAAIKTHHTRDASYPRAERSRSPAG
jgi:hypothetical protein